MRGRWRNVSATTGRKNREASVARDELPEEEGNEGAGSREEKDLEKRREREREERREKGSKKSVKIEDRREGDRGRSRGAGRV